MASPSRPTRTYQRRQLALRALTYRDIITLWPLLDLNRLDATFGDLAARIALLVVARRQSAEQLAVEYLTLIRAAADVPGVPAVATGATFDAVAFLASLRSASVISVKKAMVAGRPLEVASANALVNTLGVADHAVAGAARERIRATVDADPRARGWTRVTFGGCDWCQSRVGPVLPGSAHMAAHLHCGCVPQPVFA